MKKRIIVVCLLIFTVVGSLFAFSGCSSQIGIDEGWKEFDKALTASREYLQGKDYLIKYRYKESTDMTITQKLNVSYTNKYIDGWYGFVVVNKSVEKASKLKTDYVNSYFGYSLKSSVKPKEAKKEDYKMGYFNSAGKFFESNSTEEFFGLKQGDTFCGNAITDDYEINKYTMNYALDTLLGIDKDNAELKSADKRGAVITLKFIVKADGLYYSGYNSDSNCLVVRITVGRISKISSSDESKPSYYINYAGPKLSLPSYGA